MIKVEKLSPDALVYVNGLQVFRHQLFSHMDWQTVEVVQGNVTYSIDENEVRTMYAKVEDTSPPPVATTNNITCFGLEDKIYIVHSAYCC